MGDKVRVSHRNLLSRKLKAIISQNRLMKILKELKKNASVYKISVSKRRKAKLLSRKKIADVKKILLRKRKLNTLTKLRKSSAAENKKIRNKRKILRLKKKLAARKKLGSKRFKQRKWTTKMRLLRKAARKRQMKKRKLFSRQPGKDLQLVAGDTVSIPVSPVWPAEEFSSGALAPADQYSSLFSFKVDTSNNIQVNHELWDSIVANMPSNYSIPDPDFVKRLSLPAEQISSAEKQSSLRTTAIENDVSVEGMVEPPLIDLLSEGPISTAVDLPSAAAGGANEQKNDGDK
ncbi:hypothetical protein PN4B1_15320 [Paenibacillus naphthalenovorans]|uniref:hypothetical protein n=1 Tax=Paenibacillus naphthalenovorans TaxID=162209 RepID=UPI0010B67DFC|nr:hypothetical protein [Paenibacillus naphthalenovorans]GCL71627.1 hypothetical protein PN4B1_15320 [Paenibacillus naphthalenovorans]